MPLTLRVETSPRADGPADLSVRLDGSEHELAEVEFVTYLLQNLSPNPLRHVRDRSGGFRIDAIGRHLLGVQARVHRRDGSEEVLEH
jgi:hypothetical protein